MCMDGWHWMSGGGMGVGENGHAQGVDLACVLVVVVVTGRR